MCAGLTALHPKENNFDLMYEQVKAIKEGKSITKPIYNHVNGTLDEPEVIKPTPIVIFEGLHPFFDDRVNELMDFRIYVDITPEVKFNWKVQRDVEERGWTVAQVEEQVSEACAGLMLPRSTHAWRVVIVCCVALMRLCEVCLFLSRMWCVVGL